MKKPSPKKSAAKKSAIPTKNTSAKRTSAPNAKAVIGKSSTKKPAANLLSKSSQPTRFAHPFYTTVPQEKRALVPGVGKTMTDHIQGKLYPIPKPSRSLIFTLAEIIGQQGSDEIENSNSISFHSTGDTGRGANSPQGVVAEAMQTDFDISHPETSPAFFFHLGDVLYGTHKDQNYRPEFYEPYVHYPGKIVAIPGNHDGEVFAGTDPVSLRAFQANFCAAAQAVPPVAGTIYRETMNQPGVYYLLDAPFLQIVAMYSNAAENPGFISGAIPGQAQKAWLLATLSTIAAARKKGQRKALLFATHHPPFTAGGHSPSTEMLSDIDSVCKQAGILPDLYLSGHAHSYQRYTRECPFAGRTVEIPYVVAGIGGINDQAVPAATGQKTGDHTFVKSLKGYGYLLIKVTSASIIGTMYSVDPNTHGKTAYETFTVDLTRNTVS